MKLDKHPHCFCILYADGLATCCGCSETARVLYTSSVADTSFTCMCGAIFADTVAFQYHVNNECYAKLTQVELKKMDLV